MHARAERPYDPLATTAILTLAFIALSLWRLSMPSIRYFDEVHYVPAALALLEGRPWPNAEHPPLGKYLLAAGIAQFGDNPFGWRIVAALTGGLSLFAFARALWFASQDRFATLAYAVLLATGFILFVHARIAMLDGIMVAFVAVALWQLAATVRAPEYGRPRLILAGLALGAAMATKWNAIPLAPLPGLAFLIYRAKAGRRRLLLSRRGTPVPGVTLLEAALWLGALPLFVYAASFAPLAWTPNHPFGTRGFFGIQQMMLEMQESVKEAHNYQSTWTDWVLNRRAIWYLYEEVDAAQRGVLLIGNPLTMLLGLLAVVWAAWAGLVRGRRDALAVFVLYVVTLGFWIVASKPVQFYYHYFLPSCFLLAALALALSQIRARGSGWIAWAVLAGSTGMFAWFYPILSSMALTGPGSFADWMWLDSWR